MSHRNFFYLLEQSTVISKAETKAQRGKGED